MGYTINGVPFKMGPQGPLQPAKPADYEYGKMFWKLTEELIAAEKIKAHRITVGNGGLHGVLDGIQMLRDGKVSGTKLVYRIEDTE